MTEKKELIRDLNLEIMKNRELLARLKKQESIIKQLRATLADLGIDTVIEIESEDYIKPKRGRPCSIDYQTRQRIIKLKESGLSVRAISKKEGVSIGTISNVINEKHF